jgi:hypothetical protein
MSKLIGRFYFKMTDSKNLIGEFSNNHRTCRQNFTEGAVVKFRDPGDDKFVGVYYSTWYEEPTQCHLAELVIEKKPNCENIYTLKWWLIVNGERGGRPSFWGEGMTCDGILIGDYRDFQN